MTVIQSYNSKNTPSGKLYAVKKAEAVLLYVFTMVFPTNLFSLGNIGEHIAPQKLKKYNTILAEYSFLYIGHACGATATLHVSQG